MRHTQEMIEQGATIIDIGGESTRPGYTLISDEEEIYRVVPMIEMVKKNFDVPVSIDTYKSRVAEAALTQELRSGQRYLGTEVRSGISQA